MIKSIVDARIDSTNVEPVSRPVVVLTSPFKYLDLS